MNTGANIALVCYNNSGEEPHHGGVKVSTGISWQDKRAEDGATS